MDKTLLIYLIIIFNFYYSFEFDIESIEDYIPKASILHLNNSFSFKMFEYIPNCIEDKNETKNIYIQIYTSYRVVLYIYDNFSKIEQNNTNDEFINFNYKNIFSNGKKQYKDFICQKKYYFIAVNDNINSFIPILFQISVLDDNTNNANLIPSSQDYTFFQRTNIPENLFYTHTEDKLALINLKGDANLKIFSTF